MWRKMNLNCVPIGHKVSVCVKLGLIALLFGSSVTYFRMCEPLISQISTCNNTNNLAHSKPNQISCPKPEPCPPNKDSSQSPIDYNLHRIIYKSPGIELYMSEAYLDDRNNETYLRLFGLQRKDRIKGDFKCELHRTEQGLDVYSEVRAKHILVDSTWPSWTPHYAVNFDCRIPNGYDLDTVTLKSNDEKYIFKLPVTHTKQETKRKTLAVCVKPITGSFEVSRLVEWFELVRISGVDNIILYNSDIFGTGRYVLDYYERIGVATVVVWPFLLAVLQMADNPPVSPQERYGIYQQTYLIAMHDCLYRFRGTYEHLLFIDLDEVLLPTKHKSLIDMTKDMRKTFKNGAGFLFNTAWHFEELGEIKNESIPKFLYMQRFSRATYPGDVQPKSILATDRAISLNFHSILDVPRHEYSNEVLSSDTYGYIHHYRGRCDKKFEDWRCKKFLAQTRIDPIMVRHRKELTTNVQQVLNYLQIH